MEARVLATEDNNDNENVPGEEIHAETTYLPFKGGAPFEFYTDNFFVRVDQLLKNRPPESRLLRIGERIQIVAHSPSDEWGILLSKGFFAAKKQN